MFFPSAFARRLFLAFIWAYVSFPFWGSRVSLELENAQLKEEERRSFREVLDVAGGPAAAAPGERGRALRVSGGEGERKGPGSTAPFPGTSSRAVSRVLAICRSLGPAARV